MRRIASATSRISPAGRKSKSTRPDVGRIEVPPPAVTRKPRFASPSVSSTRARQPMSLMAA